MLFNIGDRVVPIYKHQAIGEHNIGTITNINTKHGFYVINWDLKGPETYHSTEWDNENQWNMGYDSVRLYVGENAEKHYGVIRKIKQMESRRKANGYAF
jgi:hypothetical protein